MKTYKSVKEITEAFIEDGWNKDIKFRELDIDEAHREGYCSIEEKLKRGKKFFVMEQTGNVFDEHGGIAVYCV